MLVMIIEDTTINDIARHPIPIIILNGVRNANTLETILQLNALLDSLFLIVLSIFDDFIFKTFSSLLSLFNACLSFLVTYLCDL
jgi:hypothetical protein